MNATPIRRAGPALLAAALVGLAAAAAQAQTFPAKPITVIVPYPAGGATDSIARLLAEKMGRKLGHNVIVDNKAGASGILGTDAVAKAAPDGHTVTVSLSSALLINQFLFKKLPYNAQKDIALVSQIAVAPIVLVVHPSVPAGNVAELRKYLAANKGKLSYGSWGIGSTAHLTSAHLSQTEDADLSHVPYKGEAPMLQDIVGGQIKLTFASALGAKPFIDAGKLKAIGVTGDKRMSVLPGVPTLAEQGLKDDVFRTTGWIAMAAPGGTPKAVVQRLADEVKAAVALPEVREKIVAMGFDPVARGPEEFAALYKAELPVWDRLVKQTGATLD